AAAVRAVVGTARLGGGESEAGAGAVGHGRGRGRECGIGWRGVRGRQANIHNAGGARSNADCPHHGDVASFRKPDVICPWREEHVVPAVRSPAAFLPAVRKGTVHNPDPASGPTTGPASGQCPEIGNGRSVPREVPRPTPG